MLSQHVRKTGKPIRTLVRNKSCDIKTRSEHRPIPGSWNRSIIVEAAKVSVCACASSSVARLQPGQTSVLVPRLSGTKLFDRDVVRGVITEAGSGLRLQTSYKRTAPSDRTICFGPRCIRFTSHWLWEECLLRMSTAGRFFQEECSWRYGMCMCACAQNAERESGTKPRIGHMTITHYVIQCSLKKTKKPFERGQTLFSGGCT